MRRADHEGAKRRSARPRRRRGRYGAVAALFLLGAAGPGAGGSAAAADLGWSARLAYEERYDDNITQLSPKDLDRLSPSTGGSGFGCGSTSPDTSGGRFTITTPDDFVAIPQISGSIRPAWIQGLPTSFDADLSLYRFRDNPVKNFETFRVAASQSLHRAKAYETSIGVSYERLPRYYLRNLRSDRTGEDLSLVPTPRREVTYRKDQTQARIEQELVPGRLRLIGTGGVEIRNYNPCFDERDSRMPFSQFDLVWDPRGDGRVRLRAGYRVESLHAGGDLPDTVFFTEEDVSSRRTILIGDLRFRWGRKGRRRTLRIHHESESRDYTASDPNDIFHFGRTDRRRYTTAAFQVELKKGWFVTADAERDTNRSSFPTTPGSTFDPEDTTDYTENLFQIGFGYDFGVSGARPGTRLPGTPRD